MNAFICTGLDGTNPLHVLATMGAFCTLHHAGFAPRLSWTKRTQWHPVLHVDADEPTMIGTLVAVFVDSATAGQRSVSDQALHEARLAAQTEQCAKVEYEAFADPKTLDKASKALRKAAKERFETTKQHAKALKAAAERLQSTVDVTAGEILRTNHPIVAKAQHMADVTSNGLTAASLRDVIQAGQQPYLCGLAADLERTENKKTTIARSHLSFSNNNSGKELFKDFVGVAKFANPERLRDAIFGPGEIIDPITGLGWDPASQRSYALQFTDPQKQVECQTMLHALAFLGVEAFPVVPHRRDRATVGVAYRGGSDDAPDEEDAETESEAPKAKRQEFLSWPLWNPPLSHPVVLSLLAQEQAEQHHAARGICAVVRARRFSLNKRSYFAPGHVV